MSIMSPFKVIHSDSKKELSLRYGKSHISSKVKTNKSDSITDKVTNVPYKQIFIPSYKEKSARERYMKDILQKDDYKSPPSEHFPSREQSKKQLFNSGDIMCRDMYGGFNVSQYKQSRGKSPYLSRSYTTGSLLERTTMNSRARKISSMSSDIFFTENKVKSPKNTNILTNKDNKPKELKRTFSFYSGCKKISHSKYASHGEWRYINTEFVKKIEPNNDKSRNIIFHRKEILNKGYSDIDKSRTKISKTKENLDNTGYGINKPSVNYDIISTKPKSHYKSISLLMNQTAKHEDIENYEIIVNKKFDEISSRKIKNMFFSEGIHLFGFKEDGGFTNGFNKGKFKFRVRKGNNANELNSKLDLIVNKLKKNDMKLIKVNINNKKKS